jgi:hypothetical protein
LLRDILDELAAVLRADIGAVLAGDGVDAEIEPRLVLSPSESPCIDMYPAPRDATAAAFGDLAGFYVVNVRARVTVPDDEVSQDVLMDMTDDLHELCVAASLESDPTLNGWATQVVVDAESFSGLLDMSQAGRPMIGCTWRVLIGQAVS